MRRPFVQWRCSPRTEPGARIAHISPTLLLLVVALQDHLTVADEALAAYDARCIRSRSSRSRGAISMPMLRTSTPHQARSRRGSSSVYHGRSGAPALGQRRLPAGHLR